jgi:pimeloyl-ACP methyl ester carboxylesterase
MSKRRKLLFALAAVPVLLIAGFLIWAYTPPPPMPEALQALQNDTEISVETHPWLVFTHSVHIPTTGFIFFPGGRVDARSYAPAAREIAAEGYLVVIVPVPLNLAFFGTGQADKVIAAYPEIKHWVVGGHSLGGVAASQYARSHLDQIQGLVLWASYPASSLAESQLKVISISGTQDGLSTPEKIEASHSLLPPGTRFIAIQGGNHAQFGWYGPQNGDNPASIDRIAQQAQIVTATIEFLHEISTP